METNTQLEQNKYLSEETKAYLRSEYADLTETEFDLLISRTEQLRLDPSNRQLWYTRDNFGKLQILLTIDGFRIIADRSEYYAGQTEPMWAGQDGVWKDVWLSSEPPMAAKVGIYRSDFKTPIYAIALYNECVNPANAFWNSRPAFMLAKVAESQALRRAFPQQLSGLYTNDEFVTNPVRQTNRRKQVESIKQESFSEVEFLENFIPDPNGADIDIAEASAELDYLGHSYGNKSTKELAELLQRLGEFSKKPNISADKKEMYLSKWLKTNAILAYRKNQLFKPETDIEDTANILEILQA